MNLPPGKNAIGWKWVYILNFNADGTLEQYKACGVVLDIYSKLQLLKTRRFIRWRFTTPSCMVIMTRRYIWNYHQVFNLLTQTKCLKQAPRCCLLKLSTALKQFGFKQSYSLFSLIQGQLIQGLTKKILSKVFLVLSRSNDSPYFGLCWWFCYCWK